METADQNRQQRVLRERGICVVIPTYNNGGTIGRVVAGAMAQCDDVVTEGRFFCYIDLVSDGDIVGLCIKELD
jgi:hypothetical protein